MLKLEFQGQFKKDYKLAVKRGCNVKLLQLQNTKTMLCRIVKNIKVCGNVIYNPTGCWFIKYIRTH